MSVSGANLDRTALSRRLQYERLAIYEAVLTLRDARNRSRSYLAALTVGVVSVAAMLAVFWL